MKAACVAAAALASGALGDTCAPRCGCRSRKPTVIVRHHKSGTVLGQKLCTSLELACSIKTERLQFRDLASWSATARDGCETAYTYLPASRCNSTCVDAAFRAANSAVKFVHMVREPLALILSTYLFHKSGQEPSFGKPPLAPRLKKASARAGLRMAAEEMLARALPAMAAFHERSALRTYRLEDLSRTGGFSAFTADFLAVVGFDRRECARPVQKELAGHDTARWTSRRRGKHVTTNTANTTHLRRLLVESPEFAALRAFGARLGYAYAADGAASVVRRGGLH